MTPQELKYSIICTALQGKLVKQDEAEIPVDLCTIKQKRTEEFEFDIPENRSSSHYHELLSLENSYTFHFYPASKINYFGQITKEK